MIYTVGNREHYLQGLAAPPPGGFMKLGRRGGYPGGYAFLTREDAQRRIEETGETQWAVFGLDADWERDTVPSQNGWWHALVNDRPILALGGP